MIVLVVKNDLFSHITNPRSCKIIQLYHPDSYCGCDCSDSDPDVQED